MGRRTPRRHAPPPVPRAARPIDRSSFASVPWLGTHWVDRGPEYRTMRALALLVMLLSSALAGVMTAGFAYGALQVAGPVGRTLIVAYVAVGLGLGARLGWKVAGAIDPRAYGPPPLALVLLAPYLLGAILAITVAWSLPVVPVELAAREASGHAWKQWAHDHPTT